MKLNYVASNVTHKPHRPWLFVLFEPAMMQLPVALLLLLWGVAVASQGDAAGFPSGLNSNGKARSPLANPPWIQLAGGDCCPGVTNCSTGNGPYAVSTGGDYPATTGPVCDKTPGCIAFGQMYSFVTHYYFDSAASCSAAQYAAAPIAFSFECNSGPATVPRYRSTRHVVSKEPWSCYTRDNNTTAAAAAAAAGLEHKLEQQPPPLPPIPLSELLGNWTHSGDGSTVTITGQQALDDGAGSNRNTAVRFATSCTPCCFKAGNGTVSADGRQVAVTASGVGCERLATGRVYEGTDHVTIKWTARSPDGTTRVWKDWVKPRTAVRA